MLPRLLRLLPAVEGFFSAERSTHSATTAVATQELVMEFREQMVHAAAEHRRELLELQGKFESSQQELRMVTGQLAAREKQLTWLAHQLRLVLICCGGITLAALASLIMIAVLLARSAR